MWCIPARGCRVELVMNGGFRAINLAGEGRERGSYASLEGIRRGGGRCGEIEGISRLGGRRCHLWYFWWHDSHGHEDHAERRRS